MGWHRLLTHRVPQFKGLYRLADVSEISRSVPGGQIQWPTSHIGQRVLGFVSHNILGVGYSDAVCLLAFLEFHGATITSDAGLLARPDV